MSNTKKKFEFQPMLGYRLSNVRWSVFLSVVQFVLYTYYTQMVDMWTTYAFIRHECNDALVDYIWCIGTNSLHEGSILWYERNSQVCFEKQRALESVIYATIRVKITLSKASCFSKPTSEFASTQNWSRMNELVPMHPMYATLLPAPPGKKAITCMLTPSSSDSS